MQMGEALEKYIGVAEKILIGRNRENHEKNSYRNQCELERLMIQQKDITTCRRSLHHMRDLIF